MAPFRKSKYLRLTTLVSSLTLAPSVRPRRESQWLLPKRGDTAASVVRRAPGTGTGTGTVGSYTVR